MEAVWVSSVDGSGVVLGMFPGVRVVCGMCTVVLVVCVGVVCPVVGPRLCVLR